MAEKYQFIVNPIAGQGAASRALQDIDRMAKQYFSDYEIMTTERPGHAIDLARKAALDGYDKVIAIGGDGTSNEVLNGLMQAWDGGFSTSEMGIIGIGRGNDFAYGVGILPGLQAGFDIIRKNQPRYIDVGVIHGGDYPHGRYFGNGVGIGFDAVVGFEAAKLTHLHGFTNYIVAALRTIFLFFKAPLIKLEYDDKTLSQPCLMVSIMNGRRLGGGFLMAPNALMDDGNLDLCIAGQVSRIGILKLIPMFMKGNQANHQKIKTGSATKIHVTALKGTLPTHADGETICVAGNELSIELIKKPIQILGGL